MTANEGKNQNSPTPAVAELDVAAERLGSRKLLRKVANLFRENAPRHLEDMRKGLRTPDCKLLEMSAHTFVSSIAYLAAAPATELALALEQMGRNEDLLGSEKTYASLLEELNRLDEVLDKLAAEED